MKLLSGWSRAEIDDASAVELDHLLKIDELVARVIEHQVEDRSRRSGK